MKNSSVELVTMLLFVKGNFIYCSYQHCYYADGQIYNPNREVQSVGKEEITQTYRRTRNLSVAGINSHGCQFVP